MSILSSDVGVFLVDVPDFDIYTEGKDLVDVSEYRKKWKFENSRFHTKKMKGFSV